MNQTTVHEYVTAHLASLKSYDVAAITEDFADALRPAVPEVLKTLPFPLTSAELLSIAVEAGDEVGIVHNRLVGANGQEVTMRSEWRQIDGRPRIVAGAPA